MNSKNAHGDGKNIYSLFYILSSLFFKSVPVNGLACSIVTGRVREPTYSYKPRCITACGTATSRPRFPPCIESGGLGHLRIRTSPAASLSASLTTKKASPIGETFLFVLALPIFPASHPASIVGADELNFCVRDGNRWTLIAINTNSYGRLFTVFYVKTLVRF